MRAVLSPPLQDCLGERELALVEVLGATLVPTKLAQVRVKRRMHPSSAGSSSSKESSMGKFAPVSGIVSRSSASAAATPTRRGGVGWGDGFAYERRRVHRMLRY